MSSTRVKPVGTSRINLSAEDLIALEKIKLEEEKALAECKAITNKNLLTDVEYNSADAEFKTLIEIPKKRNEPIYILPEFTANGDLHPELKKYVDAIQQNKPYHLFITTTYGKTWPVLLRLFYGLQSGFKISIEQLHSMIKVSYWLQENIILTSQPFFENSELTLYAKRFLLALKSFDDDQKNLLVKTMQDESIPEIERGFQVIQLDKRLCAYVVYLYKVHPEKNNFGSYSMIANQLEQYYLLHYKTFDEVAVEADIAKQGQKMTASLMHNVLSYYRIFYLNNHPCVILPTQTLEKKLQETLHPTRQLKYVRRLGNFGPDVMEFHIDKNERPGNLIAPGVTNPVCVHRKICIPISVVEHDDYHFLLELHNNQLIHEQMLLTKKILRNASGLKIKFSSEIYRSIDREIEIKTDDTEKLLALLELIFKIENTENRSLASLLILTDMIIHPEAWPQYAANKKRFIDTLLTFENYKPKNYKVEQVEKTIQHYAAKTQNNFVMTAILAYCHIHLKNVALCKTLLDVSTEELAWRRIPNGHLRPVIILNGKDFGIENFSQLSNAEIVELLKSNKKASLNVNLSLLAPKKKTTSTSGPSSKMKLQP